MLDETAALAKVSKARALLINSQTFFGCLALGLDVVIGDNANGMKVDTMATDGIKLVCNPKFLDGLTMPELTGVVAHEVMHVCLDHTSGADDTGRLMGRDPSRFNAACDFAVNPMLIDAGLTLPKSALINPAFANMSADQVYNLLPPQTSEDEGEGQDGAGQGDQGQGAQGDQPASDPGRCGGILPAPAGQTPAQAKALQQKWEIATAQAVQAAIAAGQLPGSIKQMVDKMRAPKIDWKEALRFFIASALPSDYAWFPPNRRYIASGLYLPALKPERLARIGLFVDSSGSTADVLPVFAGEFNAILEDTRPDACLVIECDYVIQNVREVEADDYPITFEAAGGGGTRFSPPFEYVEREGYDLDLIVVFTDGECNDFAAEPSCPVLWCSTGPMSPPYGTVLRITA